MHMARELRMAEWSGDENTVLTESPWWKAEPQDTLPDLLVAESSIPDVTQPSPDACDETTTIMNSTSQTELLQACQLAETRWMVRNGRRKVGPVTTPLLVLGILAKRVPACCEVRRVGASHWLPLRQIPTLAQALSELGSGP